MDGRILEMFMKENDAWDDLIARQSKELPQLENMLASIFKRNNLDEEIIANASLLKDEMQLQETQMLEIREHLAKQQHLLAIEQRSTSYPAHSLLSQNALREKIRDIERKFLDLKCNYLNYLATAI
ncbi:MAG: hypothetical protein RLZZ520_417 [Bacteroidota bacterium]|jgi:hypothetical protein